MTFTRQIFRTVVLAGWLVPLAACIGHLAWWVLDILIPTLKGGDFDTLYDLHQVAYLDRAVVAGVIAFGWISWLTIRWAYGSARDGTSHANMAPTASV